VVRDLETGFEARLAGEKALPALVSQSDNQFAEAVMRSVELIVQPDAHDVAVDCGCEKTPKRVGRHRGP
jgi:hypothetical protein